MDCDCPITSQCCEENAALKADLLAVATILMAAVEFHDSFLPECGHTVEACWFPRDTANIVLARPGVQAVLKEGE